MIPINYEFFIRDIFIAQRSQLEVREVLKMYIDDKGKEFLVKLLGEELCEEYLQALENVDPDPKWKSLTEILVDEKDKKSPIANYVYVSLMEDSITENTGIGVVSPQGENSEKASPVVKITWAWNKMVDMVCKDHHEIKALGFHNYAHKDQRSICSSDSEWVCGCRHKALFPKRNRFGY